MLIKPTERNIPPLIWVRIIQNLINVLRKVNVFDTRKLIHLYNRVTTDPETAEAVLNELWSILKEGKKRVIIKKEV